ncbi:MAG: hypothetical protein WDM71_06165 [Ferruginibacter sp.]
MAIDGSTGDIDLSASLPGTYTITYTVAAFGGCSLFDTTTSVTIKTATWTGAASTNNWNTGGNWSCGAVPNETLNVIIPASANVTLSANGSVNDLTLNGTSSVAMNNNILTIDGAFNGSTTGVLKGGSSSQLVIGGKAGTLYFNSGAQNFGKPYIIHDRRNCNIRYAVKYCSGRNIDCKCRGYTYNRG